MGFLGHLLYPWGFLLPGYWQSSTSSAAAGYILDLYHPFPGAPERSSILPRGASRHRTGRSVLQGLSATQRIHETRSRDSRQSLAGKLTKNSAIFTWTTANSPLPARLPIKPSAPAPIRPIPFTGAEFARSSWRRRGRVARPGRVVGKSPATISSVAAGLLAHAYVANRAKGKSRGALPAGNNHLDAVGTYLNSAAFCSQKVVMPIGAENGAEGAR